MLAREVLRLRGTIARSVSWEEEVMPDLFFYRGPEEQEKEEASKVEEAAKLEPVVEAPVEEVAEDVVAGAAVPSIIADASAPITAAPKADWTTDGSDWAQGAATDNWGGDATNWAAWINPVWCDLVCYLILAFIEK